MFAVASSWM